MVTGGVRIARARDEIARSARDEGGLLASYLTTGNAADLLAAAAGRTNEEVERLIAERFAKCARSRQSGRRGAADSRHIPAAVRRLVWERDGGRCTFVGENGTYGQARTRWELDHEERLRAALKRLLPSRVRIERPCAWRTT